jgi:hypothetical protein
MSRSFLAFALLTVVRAAPAAATTVPLVEFNWQQTDFENGPLPDTVAFSYMGFKQTPTSGQLLLDWTSQHGAADIGMSFWAAPEIVANAVAALAVPNVDYILTNGPANFIGPLNLFGADGIPSGPTGGCGPNQFCTNRFVPDFENYTVISLERVIDYLVLTEVQPADPPFEAGSYTLAASQTIRYWGIRVPESTSGVLLLVGFHGLMVTFARRHSHRFGCSYRPSQ